MSEASVTRPDDGNEEPPVRRVALGLIAGVFLGGLGGGVAFPTLPALGPVLGITPFVVGLVLSANRATRLLMNTPVGSYIDRHGTRRPMLVGFLAMGLAPFGYVAALSAGGQAAAVFLLARVLWGAGTAFVFVGAFAVITHLTTPADRGRWTGYLRGGQLLGFPAGLVLSGLLADLAGYAEAFAVAGVAGLVATAAATSAALTGRLSSRRVPFPTPGWRRSDSDSSTSRAPRRRVRSAGGATTLAGRPAGR